MTDAPKPLTEEPWLEPVARAICAEIARGEADEAAFVSLYWRNCEGYARAAYDAFKAAGMIRTPGTQEVCELAMPNRHGGQSCDNRKAAGYDCDRGDRPYQIIQGSC